LSEFVPTKAQRDGLVESKKEILWEAKKLSDGGHLEKGLSREWGFEDIEIYAGKGCQLSPRVDVD
jgi:transcription factor C subunit 7